MNSVTSQRVWRSIFLIAGLLAVGVAATLPVDWIVGKAIPEHVIQRIIDRGTPERVTFLQEQLRTGLLYARVATAVLGFWLLLIAATWRVLAALAGTAAMLIQSKPAGKGDQKAGTKPYLWIPVLWALLVVSLSIPVMPKGFEHEELLVMEMMAKRGALATMASQNLPPRAAQPAFTVIESLVVRFIGDAEWQVRLPAVVFGALTMVPLFYIGMRYGGLLLANMACGLLGTTAFFYFYINYARGYPLALLMYWLTLWLAIRIRGTNSWKDWLWMGAAIVVGCYAHMAMGVYVAVLCLVILAERKLLGWKAAGWRGLFAVSAQPVAVWGTAALLLVALYAVGEPANRDYLSKFSLTSYYMAYYVNWRFLHVMTELWSWMRDMPPVAWLQFGLFLAGVVLALRRRLLETLYLLLPLAVSLVAFGVLGLFVYPRYFLFFVPVYAFFAAYAVHVAVTAEFTRGGRRTSLLSMVTVKGVSAVLVVLTLFGGGLGMRRLYAMERCGVKVAIKDAKADLQPGEQIAGVLDAYVTVKYYCPEAISMFSDKDFWSVLNADNPPQFIVNVPYLEMDIPGGTKALKQRYELYREYPSWLDVDDDQDSVYLYRRKQK